MEQVTSFSTLRVTLYPADAEPCLTSANDILRMLSERIQVPIQAGPAGAKGKDSDAFNALIDVNYRRIEFTMQSGTSTLSMTMNEAENGIPNANVNVYVEGGNASGKKYITERTNTPTSITVRMNGNVDADVTIVCAWSIPSLIIEVPEGEEDEA